MHTLVRLAKNAVEEYVLKRRVLPCPDDLTAEMKEKAGVFICLKKHGELRGCIGTFMPCHENVAEEIIRNAISAATEDPRFSLVTKDELPHLTYTVDVLSPPEKITDVRDLDPKRYGVIIASGGLKGLLLPDLEGIETAEDQIRIARMKAGIGSREDIVIYRFEVRRYH